MGDIQTEPAHHDGLTAAGVEVIHRCNKFGVIVDVAHGTYALVKKAAVITTKPLVLSHTRSRSTMLASLPQLAAALRARFNAEETAKLLGGNYQRVFAASLA